MRILITRFNDRDKSMMHKNLLRAYEKSQETFKVELWVRRTKRDSVQASPFNRVYKNFYFAKILNLMLINIMKNRR